MNLQDARSPSAHDLLETMRSSSVCVYSTAHSKDEKSRPRHLKRYKAAFPLTDILISSYSHLTLVKRPSMHCWKNKESFSHRRRVFFFFIRIMVAE